MRLRYNLYRIRIRAKEEIHLPAYKGSTFRGAFGVAFKRVVCALRKADCKDCLLNSRCVYAYIFESRPEGNLHVFGRVATIPRPYVIEPPLDEVRSYQTGEPIEFNLLLIGRAIEYLPYFVYAFDELGKQGIGRGNGKFSLEMLEVLRGKRSVTIYSGKEGKLNHTKPEVIDLKDSVERVLEGGGISGEESTITLRFVTPTRIKHRRHLTKDMSFDVLMRQVLRRLFLLWYFHSRGEDEVTDVGDYHKRIIKLAEQVSVAQEALYWYDWRRYSNRQGCRMKLGGFLGDITYRGSIDIFIPFLRACEILHVGKGTTFGLGKYWII